MTYFLMFNILFLGAIFFELNNFKGFKKYSRLFYFFVIFLLVLISAFRYRIAPDSVAYAYFFNYEIPLLKDLSYQYITESRFLPLWLLICSICKEMGGYLTFQFVISFFSLSCVSIFIKKYSVYPIVSVLFFYIFFYHYFSMEILRESVAIALFLLSVVFFERARFLSLVFILMTLFIHQFAFILVFLYIAFLIRPALIYVVSVFAFLFCLFALLSEPLMQLQTLMSFAGYIDLSNYDLQSTLSINGYINYLMKIIIPSFIMWKYLNVYMDLSKNEKYIFSFMIVFYAGIYSIRMVSLPYIERFVNYATLFVVVFLVNVFISKIQQFGFLIRNLLFFITTSLCVAFSIYPLLKNDVVNGNTPIYKRYYPYSSILEKSVDSDRELVIKLEAKE